MRGSQDSVGGDKKGQRPQASAATFPCSLQACPPTQASQVPTPTPTHGPASQHVGGNYKVRLEHRDQDGQGRGDRTCVREQASLKAGGHTVAGDCSRLTIYAQKRMGDCKMAQWVK